MRGPPAVVLPLDRLGAADLPVAGGKAAGLGELMRAGLPVPPGFCVSTDAYRRAVAATGLAAVLDALAATPAADTGRLAELAALARAAVLAAPIPDDVRAAVTAAYAALGQRAAVAVRSSATAEDLPSASFAGQQDTYLNVVGEEAVLDAVRRCWASLWTDRAVSYRAVQGIDPRSVRLAVVVQSMVDATVAGVLFTANPVTGRRGEAVVDASPGLGEAVVSGAVDPDHVVLDTATGAILQRRLGAKRTVVEPVPGGGTRRVERSGDDGRPALTDVQLRDLAALGRRVEAHAGAPQDVEWALDAGGTLWLTQARPITTLFPLPADRPVGDGSRVYVCLSLAQGLVRPLTPMGLSGFRLLASSTARVWGFPVPDPLAGPPAFVEAGQRIFVDLTPVLTTDVGRALAPRVGDLMEARTAAVLRGLSADPRFAPASSGRLAFARRVGGVLLRHRAPVTLVRVLARPAAARAILDRRRRDLTAATAAPTGAGGEELLDHVERVLGRRLAPALPTLAPVAVGAGFAMLALAARLLRGSTAPGDLQAVLRALPHNVTTEMDLRLWKLAESVRGAPDVRRLLGTEDAAGLARRYRRGDLPAALQNGLADFLTRYGHRAVAEIDLGLPRWSEDPTHLLAVLAGYARLEDPATAPDVQFARGARDAEEAVRRLVGLAARRGRWRAVLVAFALGRVRELAGLRETPKFVVVSVLAELRAQLAEVGATLAEAGRVAVAEDVFFLTLVEARRGLRGDDLHEVVAARRAAYDAELRRRHVPRVLLSDGTEPEALAAGSSASGAASSAGLLTGTPASAGTVTGTARVVLDPVGARLGPGEILVAPSTDPGWTPLFLLAGGLVMEMGGPNSHGAVVAREYGIPAVVGVTDATIRIRDGETVTVDGARGTVAPSRAAASAAGTRHDEGALDRMTAPADEENVGE